MNRASISMMAKITAAKSSKILHAGGKVAQGGEQTGIEHRGPGLDPEQSSRFLLLAGGPVHHGKRRSEGDLVVQRLLPGGQGARGEGQAKLFVPLSTVMPFLARADRDVLFIGSFQGDQRSGGWPAAIRRLWRQIRMRKA